MKHRIVLLVGAALVALTLAAAPAQAQYDPNFVTLSTTVAPEGGGFNVSGGYFDANSNVEVIFNSTPVVLGTLVAGTNGVASGGFTVPTGVGIGSHTVQLSGTSRGSALVLNAAIEVVAQGTTAPAAGQPSGTLPVTGSSSTGRYAAIVAGLIVLGSFVVLATRRRRDTASV